MTQNLSFKPLTFVWNHHYFSHSFKQLSDQAGISIIVDVSELSLVELAENIEQFSTVDLKLSRQQFFYHNIQDLLVSAQIDSFWVEFFPDLSHQTVDDFFSQASSYDQIDCHVISGDLHFIQACLDKGDCIASVGVKGFESSGLVGNETILSIITYLETKHQFGPNTLPVHIWGGITTPEGAAICLASGIERVIFENLHCMTNKCIGHDAPKIRKFNKLDINHSAPIALGSNQHFRTHDRGNSLIVKEIKRKRDNLGNDRDTTSELRELASLISSTSVSPFDADFTADELIPLGPEAAAASSFVKRFGDDTVDSIHRFEEETRIILQDSSETLTNMLNGRATDILGTRYPFIQGAMACISDVPEFSLAVAKAGGLPTIGLGIKSTDEIENELSDLRKLLNGLPYAINIITLPENPHRKEQLAWVEKTKPPFVVISAGAPFKAVELQKKGIEVIYVTSDIGLARLAWENGIRFVVCEGNEAGGHIGRHTTMTLAQEALECKRQLSAEGKEIFLFLAGGIYNGSSCARAALLGADGVQMGTVYLSSHEIVSSGALSELYQKSIINASFGTTKITGKSIGLRVRSLDSPKIRTIVSLEQELNRQTTDESDKRQQIEEVSIGSLFVAAKGRHPISGKELTQDQCGHEGQFMSGTIAGMLTEPISVQKLHLSLAHGKLTGNCSLSQRSPVDSIKQKSGQQSVEKERIAITGMAAINSLGNNPEEIWQACLSLKSGLTQVPNDKWNHDAIYRPDSNLPGTTYCNVGGFLFFDISRQDLGIAPHVFRTMSTSTKMTLWLAQQAIGESAIIDSDIPRHRIGVVISQNAGECASTVGQLSIHTGADEIEQDILSSFEVVSKKNKTVAEVIQDDILGIDDTTLLGRLNCAAGGYICNRYGLTGPSFAVTTACASSLTALYNAILMIRAGVLDGAIVGGGEELIVKASFLEFSALGALAGLGQNYDAPAAHCRPFDVRRSGMILGEGGGMLVIERESVALKRGAPILAYINGIGASNNHQGMIESIAETQKIAIQNSFDDAGYLADQVDLVECHATSTRQGDQEEAKALSEIYPPNSSTVLTSFKSQIGHTLGASGIISLIRGVCAMRDSIYPPTLNYDQPDPKIGLEKNGFRILNQPEEWKTSDKPRRLQVNSFGFGGANYVMQLEEAAEPATANNDTAILTGLDTSVPVPDQKPQPNELGISFYRYSAGSRKLRIASLNKTMAPVEISGELHPLIQQGRRLDTIQTSKLRKQGLYVDEPSFDSPLALVFSGQGSSYPQMGKQLYKELDCIRHWIDTFDELCKFDLPNFLFSEENDQIHNTKWVQPALFALEYAIYQQLKQFNIQPVALAGHSMGEICALCVADCFSYQDGIRIIIKRGELMEKAGHIAEDPGSMMAVDAPADFLEEHITKETDLYFTNFNSPRQTVLGGSINSIQRFKEILDQEGYWNAVLPVSMVFHSPIMRSVMGEFKSFLSSIDMAPPRLPVLSNVTKKAFPNDTDRMVEILVTHLESPVYWQDNVLSLWNEYGVRTFFEIGPRNTLSNLINDTVSDAHCIHCCFPENEMTVFKQSIASLYICGNIEGDSISELDIAANRNPATAFSANQGDMDAISKVVLEEIFSYAGHGFEKYLKPVILQAIQQRVDPHFNEQQLNSYLPDGLNSTVPTSRVTIHTEEPTSEKQQVLEQVIQIIMEVTGYERDEIRPEMDVRQDLAIQSSRIPIIIDIAEKTFNFQASLEDFMTVQTIDDLAETILRLTQGGSAPHQQKEPVSIPSLTVPGDPSQSPAKSGINRMVFRDTECNQQEHIPVEIAPDSHLLLLFLTNGNHTEPIIRFFNETYNSRVTSLSISPDRQEDGWIDLFKKDGVEIEFKNLLADDPIAGVLVLSDSSSEELLSVTQINCLTSNLFVFFQHLVRSTNRSFYTHLHLDSETKHHSSLLTQSLLGLFLTGRYEYSDLLLRSMTITGNHNPAVTLPIMFNRVNPILELLYRDHKLYSRQIVPAPLSPPVQPQLTPGPDDVIVLTGGGHGITSYVARALAPFGCTLVLIGRTPYDLSLLPDNYNDDLNKDEPSPGYHENSETILQIGETLAELEQLGAQPYYYDCDVTLPDQVDELFNRIAEKFGKIDGIIHGAGVIRDSFIPLITPEMFNQVMDVKSTGADNLLKGSWADQLRFAVAFSSLSGILGNPGQANYGAANRAMAEIFASFGRHHPSIVVKVFWLPPIEGAGMADAEDIKDIIVQHMGSDVYIDVTEASQIILAELFAGDPDDCWVAPCRTYPQSEKLLGAPTNPEQHWLKPDTLPMIDSIDQLDLVSKTIHAHRKLSIDRDLWLGDHIPSKLFKRPIISAIMAVEGFLEIGQLLFPYLLPTGMENVQFVDMVECSPEADTHIHLIGQGLVDYGKHNCRVELKKTMGSPEETITEQLVTAFSGQVVFSPQPPDLGEHTITRSKETEILGYDDICELYEQRSGLKNRYRVLQSVTAVHPDGIEGTMIYPLVNDFDEPGSTTYLYPHYLLEALMQITFFFSGIRDIEDNTITIPASISSLLFVRNCLDGEEIYLYGELLSEDSQGTSWNLTGIDKEDKIIMKVDGLKMRLIQ